MSFSIDIKGIPEAKLMFDVAGSACSKASREYVQKMGRLAVKQEKTELVADGDIRTGSLYASLKTKIPYMTRLGYYVSISGPSKSFGHFIRWRKSGKYAGRPLLAQPAKYAHLVEGGTEERHTKSGANRGSMPAHHYTEHSWEKLQSVNASLAKQIYEKALNA